MLAKFYPETGVCQMSINQKNSTASNEMRREKCSLGVSSRGGIGAKKYDWDHWTIGPCWTPVDFSGGVSYGS